MGHDAVLHETYLKWLLTRKYNYIFHHCCAQGIWSRPRIIEYPELEGIYTKSRPYVVQMLLEFLQFGALTTALSSVPEHSGADPAPDTQLSLPWHSPMLFPWALSLSHRAELSAAPLLPVRSCSRHQASLQLLCSALNKPKDLSHSSYISPCRPFTIFVVPLWMLFSKSSLV